MDKPADLNRLLAEAKKSADQAAQSDAELLAYLLADDGFDLMEDRHYVANGTTGITAFVLPEGIRISFPHPDADRHLAVVDLPNGTAWGVVAHIVAALSRAKYR